MTELPRTGWELSDRLIDALSQANDGRRYVGAEQGATWLEDSCDRNSADTFHRAMEARRSVRRFGEASLEEADLMAIIAAGWRSDNCLWAEYPDASPLGFLILARRVHGLAPGAYRFLPDEARLAWVAEVPDGDDLRLVVPMQPEFTSAAAMLITVGNIEAAWRSARARGYRELMVRVGAATAAAWLKAVAIGLEGGMTAGVDPRILSRRTGLSDLTERALLLLSIGVGLKRPTDTNTDANS